MIEDYKGEPHTRFPSWEIIAVIVGFFSSASEVPNILNKIFTPTDLLSSKVNFSRVAILIYAVILFMLSSKYLIKILIERKEGKTEKVDLEKIYDRIVFKSYLKTLGLAFIFNIIRNKAKISLYDEFIKPTYWTIDHETFPLVYRIWTKKDAQSISLEIRMLKNFSGYKIKETLDEVFDEPKERTYFELYNKLFAFTSAWLTLFTIAHVSLRPFQKFIFNKVYANSLGVLFYLVAVSSLIFWAMK